MYAVVTTGGKQYRVEAGAELVVERLAADPGASVTFDRVLLLGDGDDVTVGTPTIDGATVSGTVIGEQLGPKLIVFKFKQKVKYRRTRGHRQHLTRVRIDEISAGGRRRASKAERSEEAAPTATAARSAQAAGDTATPARTRRTAASKATGEAAEDKPARRRTTARKPKAEE